MTTRLPLPAANGGGRFPGFDVMNESEHWDDATKAVIVDRTHSLPPIRFFTPTEEAAATALFDQLMDQRSGSDDDRIDLLRTIDRRLTEHETDGWHYDTMPTDEDAWRQTLAHLDSDATEAHGCVFAECSWDDQHALIHTIHDSDEKDWHGLPRKEVWSLWTRYAATAFYAHPAAWNEIGFSGPAYPRGYKNRGVNKLEPYEVHDARPSDDPLGAGR